MIVMEEQLKKQGRLWDSFDQRSTVEMMLSQIQALGGSLLPSWSSKPPFLESVFSAAETMWKKYKTTWIDGEPI